MNKKLIAILVLALLIVGGVYLYSAGMLNSLFGISEINGVVFKIPEGYSVKYLPPALRVQSPYVEFEIIYDQQGDEIDITRKLAFPRRYIPVKDYESYKSDLEKIAHSSKQKIFLEQKQKNKTDKSHEKPVSDNEIKETDTAIPNTDTNSSDTANLENVEGAQK